MGKYRQIVLLLLGAVFFFVMGGVVLSKSFQSTKLKTQVLPSPEVQSFATEPSNVSSETSNLIRVDRVVDGDTIVLEGGWVLRYIGIDTPETKDPRKPVQCFGEKASEENKKLVEGKMVRLEKDVSETDRYGRLLRYVYVDDIFVNDYLVKGGFSHASSYPPDVRYQQQFTQSEKEARENNRGLWSNCVSTTPIRSDVVVPSATPDQNANNVQTGNINCSTNSYNCSSFKTQAEAQKVFDTCGGTSNDVHKLDRDGDGRVCETLP